MHVTSLLGLIVLASYDEYTALVKSGNVASEHVRKAVSGMYRWWKVGYRDLLSYVTFFWLCGLSLVVPSARVNWCSCASIVIFFEQCCDQFVVQFLCPVFSHQCVAQCTLHEFAFSRGR